MLIEIPFTGYSGLEKIPVSAVVGVLPSGITLGSISNSTATKDGLIILNIAKGANLGGSNILNGSIDITFKIENKNIVKKFSWCKTKDGADGAMTIYELFSSVPLLNKEVSDVISPNKITFTSYTRKSNTTTTSPYEGMFIVKESENGVTYTSKYISTQNESSVEYTLSSNKVISVQCSLCEAGTISNELDRITIPVLTNESIKSEITEIKTQISGVSSKVDSVEKSITDKVWQSDITTQINNYDNTTIKSVKDQIAENKTEIGKISNTVSDVQSTLINKADGSTVQKLEERVAKNEQTAEGFKQTVEQNYVTNDKLGETSQTLRSELEQTAGTIQGQITDLSGNVTQVTQTLTNVEQRVETAQGDISSLKLSGDAIKSDVENAKGDISQLQQTATNNSSQIENLKGDITKVDQKANEIVISAEKKYATKDEMKSAISVTSDEIKLSVKEVKETADSANDKIDNLEIGGRNLLLKTSEERVVVGTGKSSEASNEYLYSEYGSKSLHGGKYSVVAVSYDYVTDDATSGTIIVQSYNDVSTNLSSINLSETIKSGHVEEVFKIPDTWGNSTNAGVKFLLNNVTGTVRFSNLKLELGNKSTDWSPAPEDIQSSLNSSENKSNNALEQTSEVRSSIEILKKSIETLVTDENGQSLMTQTGNGWTFNMGAYQTIIDKVTSDITDVKGDVDEVNQLANNASQLANDVATKTAYINMSTDDTGSPCIELGKSDNEFKLRITNTSIDFMQGSQKIAYITNQSLYIQSSVVTDEMKVGDESGYIWKKRSNGNMGLRYVS